MPALRIEKFPAFHGQTLSRRHGDGELSDEFRVTEAGTSAI